MMGGFWEWRKFIAFEISSAKDIFSFHDKRGCWDRYVCKSPPFIYSSSMAKGSKDSPSRLTRLGCTNEAMRDTSRWNSEKTPGSSCKYDLSFFTASRQLK